MTNLKKEFYHPEGKLYLCPFCPFIRSYEYFESVVEANLYSTFAFAVLNFWAKTYVDAQGYKGASLCAHIQQG